MGVASLGAGFSAMFLYFPMWGGLFFPARKGATEEVGRLPPAPLTPCIQLHAVQLLPDVPMPLGKFACRH